MKKLWPSLFSAVLIAGCNGGTQPPNKASTTAVQATPASCPAADFPGFLRAFAADARMRMAHTAPAVRVTDWVDVDETGHGTSTELVPRERYDEFKLRHHDGRFVHVENEDMPDRIPVEPRVTPLPDGYRVEYIFNMSEGNSWTFARTPGCWRLVADPDPSLL